MFVFFSPTIHEYASGWLSIRQISSAGAGLLRYRVFLHPLSDVTKTMQTRGKRACSLFPECSLPYTKIIKAVCNVNTITLFFRNQEYIKKYKITVLNVKSLLLQTENYAVEIRKTESESKNGSIRHIAQHPVTQRIIQNNLPTTLFPVHDKGFSAKPKRLFRHAGKTLRHPQTHFPAAPKSPFDRNKAR